MSDPAPFRDLGDVACREVVEVVTDYLEGVLTADQQGALEAHLAACGGCTAYLDQMRRTIGLSHSLARDDLPAPVLDGLLAVMRGATGT
jgi:anti-sigma factor RsiW